MQKMFQYAYGRLTSRDPEHAWAAGLFMTERSGGSNVYELETVASPHIDAPGSEEQPKDADGFDLGPWRINGFKFFSSGTESEMAFILARTHAGLSLFYAPLYRKATNGHGASVKVLNGVKIQRLKQKLGTWPKTTAELEFDGTRAWLVGREGEGIKEVVHVLNIGRIHVGTSALGLWSRGLSIVKSFSKLRKVGDRPLTDVPMYIHNLAGLHIAYRGQLALMLFVGALLGKTEQPECADRQPLEALIPELGQDVDILLRLLTPIAKVLSVKTSIDGLLQCMGALGGVGFLENEEAEMNIARMYRDATMHVVLDGTPDALTNEVIRVLSGKTSVAVTAALDSWIQNIMPKNPQTADETLRLLEIWMSFKADIESSTQAELLLKGHQVVERLGSLVSGILLIADACRDFDEVSVHVAKEWMSRFAFATSLKVNKSVEETLLLDTKVIFG
jgi:alkylation response protein AidB-like acyl-CoA dehydrogenase